MFPAFYYSALALSLGVSVYVALLAWRHRKSRGAPAMLALAAATLVWTLGFLFESRSTSLTEQLFFNNLGYIGAMSVPAIWFIFTVQYTFHKLTSWKSIAPLFIVPVFIAALVWTNESHHLMWSNEHLVTAGTFLVTAKTYGPMFWVAYSYNYAMVLLGTYLLVRRVVVGAPLFAGQAVSLIIAAGLPVVWNIIYVFDLWNLPRKDLTPAMFAFSGLAVILGVLRFRLLTVVPFARQFVVEQLRDGIMAFDTHGRILEVNSAALTATGLSLEAVGKDIGSVSGLSPVFPAIYPFKNGRIELPVAVSGENRFFELETTAMKDSCERLKGWLVVLRDVTERKQMQQQLIMQDRLASIGQLVSGVAHELNNPLTSVIGFSNLILDKNIPVEFREDLIIVRDEAQRTADIVSSLLVFARGQENTKQPTDVNAAVQTVLKLRARAQFLENITVLTSLEPDLPFVMGNNSQLQQVFFNIVINAEHAMVDANKKGTLTVSTEKNGDAVRVVFADDGCGINQENMARLFTPFFTTKDVGKGTGLGLSICQGIISEHGGKIWAESEPGKGASFIIELPVPDINQNLGSNGQEVTNGAF